MSRQDISDAFNRLADLVGRGESVDAAADIVAGELMDSASQPSSTYKDCPVCSGTGAAATGNFCPVCETRHVVPVGGQRIDFEARDLPSYEWIDDLILLLRSARNSVAFNEQDAAEKWHNVCEHWLTRYSTDDGREGNSE